MRRTVISALTAAGLLLVAAAAPANAGLSRDNVGEWQVLDTTYEDPNNPVWTPGAVQTESQLSEILSPWRARLTWELVEGTNDLGTSIEEPNIGLEVDAGDVAYFSYDLKDGAEYVGGAPRLFVTVDTGGDLVTLNTWDHGYQFDDFTAKAVDLPAGVVTHVGIVYDNGVEGSVVVTNPVIANVGILFDGAEVTDAPSTVVAGDEVSVSAVGFFPNEDVSGVLNSDPVDLGIETADGEGAVTFTFGVPSDISAGTHTVTLLGLQSGLTASVSIEVTAPSEEDDGDDGTNDADNGTSGGAGKSIDSDGHTGGADAPRGHNPGLSSNTGHGSTGGVAPWVFAVLATAAASAAILLRPRLVTSHS